MVHLACRRCGHALVVGFSYEAFIGEAERAFEAMMSMTRIDVAKATP